MRFEFIADEHVKVKTFLKSTRFLRDCWLRLSFEVELFWSIINRKCNVSIGRWNYVTIDIPAEKALKPWRLLSIH